MTRYICSACGVAFAGPPHQKQCGSCSLSWHRQIQDKARTAAELKRQQAEQELADWLAQDVH